MSKIVKTKSGNWQTLVYDYTDEKGKRHYESITRPTKAECELAAAQFKRDRQETPKNAEIKTVKDAVVTYINLRRPSRSITTITRYEGMAKYAFPDLMKMRIKDINGVICQQEANKELERPNAQNGRPLALKTVIEEWRLIKSALKVVCGKDYKCEFMPLENEMPVLPPAALVNKVITGLDTELECRLAFEMSLRMSEVRGLEYKHIENGCINIIQTKVVVKGKDVIKKYTKNETSCRRIPITPNVQRLLEENPAYKAKKGFICAHSSKKLYNSIHNAMKKEGYDFNFHDLRHEFASVCINVLKIPVVCVQQLGGWANSTILYKKYVNNMDDIFQESVKNIGNFYSDLRQ